MQLGESGCERGSALLAMFYDSMLNGVGIMSTQVLKRNAEQLKIDCRVSQLAVDGWSMLTGEECEILVHSRANASVGTPAPPQLMRATTPEYRRGILGVFHQGCLGQTLFMSRGRRNRRGLTSIMLAYPVLRWI